MHLSEIDNKQFENIFAIGDTHSLDFVDLLEYYVLDNFILIHVGDAGEGYGGQSLADDYHLGQLEKYCEKNNGKILIVRGNHSNPDYYFPPHWTEKFKHISFVPDYTYLTLNDKKFLFVGGGLSIDRVRSLQEMRDGGFTSYWKNENFILPEFYHELPKCDVLVTHIPTTKTYPFVGFDRIRYYLLNDPPLEQELVEEKEKAYKLCQQVKPKLSLFGHWHTSHTEEIDGILYKCLDINEVVDLTETLKL